MEFTPNATQGNNGQPNTLSIDPIPKSLILGTVSYSVDDNPELKAFVTGIQKHVAQTEKAKLYTQINSLSEQVKSLMAVKIESNQNAPVPVDNAQFKAELLKEVGATVSSLLKTALEPIVQRSALTEQASLADYRNKLVADNQGKLIPELVVGSTREEIDANFKQSLKLFEQYGNKTTTVQTLGTAGALPTTPVQVQNNQQVDTTQQIATPVTVQDNGNTNGQVAAPVIQTPAKMIVDSGTDLNISKMTEKEFAANRDRLFAEVNKLVN